MSRFEFIAFPVFVIDKSFILIIMAIGSSCERPQISDKYELFHECGELFWLLNGNTVIFKQHYSIAIK